MAQERRISVVIPTLNEERYIGKCLESLRKQTLECEIIVVDSESSDKTAALAGKNADKIVIVEKKSIAYSRQRGAESCLGEIVVSTDADCVFPANWLEVLCKHFEDESVACVSGPTKPILEESTMVDRVCYWVGNTFLFVLLKVKGVPWFRGSNTAYRKDFLMKAGGYNTSLKAREDSELSKRVGKLGKAVFDWNAVAFTSMRRRRQMGWLKTLRYYLDTPISLITKKVYYEKAD